MERVTTRDLNWEEIEYKVNLICRKFDNIPDSLIDDLAQELRIHAYYKSDDYYDLLRRAIQFWRSIHAQKNSALPFFDLEMIGGSTVDSYNYNLSDIVDKIRYEIRRTPTKGYWDTEMVKRAEQIFDIILEDIDENMTPRTHKKIAPKKYINGRISLSWLSEDLGVSYRSVENTMAFLADTVLGMIALDRISVEDYQSLLKNFLK